MYNFSKFGVTTGTGAKDPYNFSIGSTGPPTNSKTTTSTALQKNTPAPAPSAKGQTQKSKEPKSKILSTDFVPKRFGVRYNPPTIILEYILPGNGKLYHHKMKMLKLQSDTPTKHVIEYLKKKHYQYFLGNKIPDSQLTTLIEKMKKRMENYDESKPSKARPSTASTTTSTNNKTTPTPAPSSKITSQPQKPSTPPTNATAKSIPQVKGSQPQITGANKANPLLGSKTTKISQQEYDAYGQDEDEVFDYAWSKKQQATMQQKKAVQYDEAYEDEYPDEDEEEEEYDEDEIELTEEQYQQLYYQMGYDKLNMNKLTNEELNKHKAIMEQMYKKNIIRPGDPGYQYNVEKQFIPQQDNEWDMDEDEDYDIV